MSYCTPIKSTPKKKCYCNKKMCYFGLNTDIGIQYRYMDTIIFLTIIKI